MAAPESPTRDKGRPPDTPIFGKKVSLSKNCTKYSYVTKSVPTNPFLNGRKQETYIGFNELLEDNIRLVQDVNKNNFADDKMNKSTTSNHQKLDSNLLKILCLKKNSDSHLKTLSVNSLESLNGNKCDKSEKSASKTTLDNKNVSSATSNSYYPEKQKNRNSFHQNVEEALSSLLWQPYEYQNQNNNECSPATNGNNDYYDYESYSTCSYTPSTSPISLDLDDTFDNAASPSSNTKKTVPSSTFLQCTAVPPLHRRDLHSDVINLNQQETASQSEPLFSTPRDDCLLQQRSDTAGAFVSLLASSLLDSEYMSLPPSAVFESVVTSCSGEFSVDTSMHGGSGQQSATNSDNGLKSTPIQADFSLNAANIVGLPSSHARYASVPCSGTSASFQNAHAITRSQQNVYPQHFRNVSEPSQQQCLRYSNNGQIVPVPLTHQKLHGSSNSQIDQHNLQLINHFRSSSVPKSMTLVPKYDVTTSSGPSAPGSLRIKGTQVLQQNNIINNIRVATNKPANLSVPVATSPIKPQISSTLVPPNQNVSNVNVNFYRAVPVNVVSSVPTIHCLNTLSNDQGNSVSNVQVLPLGNNHPQLFNEGTSSTQVTVQHNVNQIKIDNGNKIITSTIGYPEQNFRISNNNNNNGTGRTTTGVPVSVINGLAKNVLLPSSVINVQTNTSVLAEVPYSQAGRVITTTAQINNDPGVHQTPSGTSIVRTRTFTSTEAQTDEIISVPQESQINQNAREQRRRERRERRQNRRNNHRTTTTTTTTNTTSDNSTTNQNNQQENRLPDILNSHLPPPYSTLPNHQNASMVPPQILPPPMLPGAMLPNSPVLQTVVPNPGTVPASAFVFPAPQQMAPLMQGGAPVPVAVPATAAAPGFRFGFPANGFRRSRFSDDSPKGCCSFFSWKPGSLRWFIALIALVAVCCVLVGTALGAMRPAGRDHLTVSLLMIGVGIVLITVSGVAWRLTSHDSSTCRSMLGLGSTESVDVCTRRFVPRLPPSYGRPHHPYAAMMYPEFQYRPPPPSYQASMQEYRLRLLLLDRGNTPQIQAGIQNAVSPPPTYRSHAGSLLRAPLSSRREANQSEYSCPPSYRSQNSSNRPVTLPNGSVLHSRDPSLTISDSNQESVVNVVNILGSTEEGIALDNITLDSLKMEPEATDPINPLKMLLKGSQSDLEGSKDGNLVTIVQTSDQNPVIVTVSGCSAQDNNSTVQITEIPSEMEILAHL